MPMPLLDFRSDLQAKPSPAMRQAMLATLEAAPAFHPGEDPVETRLAERVAALLGQEAAILLPTCTMANQIALRVLAQPGDALVAPADSHVLTSEGGATALGGLQVIEVPGDPRRPDVAVWRAALARWAARGGPRPATMLVENTHNRSGGGVVPPAALESLQALAREHGLTLHCDGARLFNAATALGVTCEVLAQGFDTVSLSLNKGAGAPYGAILASSRTRVAQARLWQMRLGGALRRTGPLAAAALVALDDLTPIAADHRRARRLADELCACPGVSAVAPVVETNIVIVRLDGWPAAKAAEAMAARGVLCLPWDGGTLRFVLHRDLDDAAVDTAIAAMATLTKDAHL